jgi:alanyl-tRNA synthetase
VRVVDIAGFSRELCGGTHVERTGDIGPFKVVQERAVQAGVRRIEALTGPAAVEWILGTARRLREVARELAVPEEKVKERVLEMRAALREAKEAAKKAPKAAAAASAASTRREVKLGAATLHLEALEGASVDDLRARWDELKKAPSTTAVLVAPGAEKTGFIAAATKDIATPEWKAAVEGAAKEHGGRAGGKPDMVQGGLPSREKVEAFLSACESAIAGAMGARA